VPSGPDRQIEELLERAGRDAQPRSERWDTLRARLAATPQLARRRPLRWGLVLGAAAMIVAAVGLAFYLSSGPAALAALGPIEVIPQDIEITVFNETETHGYPLFTPTAQPAPHQAFAPGQFARQQRIVQFRQPAAQQMEEVWRGPTVKSGMALVKDHRLVVNLRKGDNIVRCTDVAATIDPTSVRFVSDTDPVGTFVVEQNFEYDLATAAALLRRYIDKKITCVDKDGGEVSGYLCSHDDSGIVLAETAPRADAPARKTQTLSRDDVRAVRLDDVPKDLFVKPTLVWKLRTQREGKHHTTLSYVCGHVKWDADYVAVVTPGTAESGDRLDLQGWVTIDNRSGSTYRDAGIKLIAGDVNRVADPWAPQIVENVERYGLAGGIRFARERVASVKVFEEKEFFEYHLYTLSAPSTVREQQIKQLKLLKAGGVRAERLYVFSPTPDSSFEWSAGRDPDPHKVAVQLVFKNEKANAIGMPLPKGRVRLMQQDTDGDLGLIGEDHIDHTPKDEEIKLKIGYAFDVTAEQIVLDTKRPAPRRQIVTLQLRMRNHKDEAIRGRFVARMRDGQNWTITDTTAPWTRESVNTVHFDFVLGTNEEKTITYTVDYTW